MKNRCVNLFLYNETIRRFVRYIYVTKYDCCDCISLYLWFRRAFGVGAWVSVSEFVLIMQWALQKEFRQKIKMNLNGEVLYIAVCLRHCGTLTWPTVLTVLLLRTNNSPLNDFSTITNHATSTSPPSSARTTYSKLARSLYAVTFLTVASW